MRKVTCNGLVDLEEEGNDFFSTLFFEFHCIVTKYLKIYVDMIKEGILSFMECHILRFEDCLRAALRILALLLLFPLRALFVYSYGFIDQKALWK
jgi:hypothetical protein